MICVGASDSQDQVSVWNSDEASNYGAHSVDLFAPGTSIRSTYFDGGYKYMRRDLDGRRRTSPAPPRCVLGASPSISTAQLRNALLSSVDPSRRSPASR